MNLPIAHFVAALSGCATFHAANAAQLGVEGRAYYSPSEIKAARALYSANIRGNFYDLVTRFDEPLHTKAMKIDIALPDRSTSPLQFFAIAEKQTVFVPIESVKFIDDLFTAYVWREAHGCDPSAVYDYMGMLTFSERRAELASPLVALAVPPDVLKTDLPVYENSGKLLKSAIYFLLAHELGHVVLAHPGNRSVPRSVSRAHEQEADAFALDAMAKIGIAPVGMVFYFRAATYYEGPPGGLAEGDYKKVVAAVSTHPLAADRIHAIARGLKQRHSAFEEGTPPPLLLSLVTQLEGIAALLDDVSMRNFQARRSIERSPSSLRSCSVWSPKHAH